MDLELIRAFVEGLDEDVPFGSDVSEEYRTGYNHARKDLAGSIDAMLSALIVTNARPGALEHADMQTR